MKLLVGVLALLSASTAVAQSSDWVPVGSDADHNPVAIDGTTFTFEKPTVIWFWERTDYKRKQQTGYQRLRIDCDQNSWAPITLSVRDKVGHVVEHYDFNGVHPRAIPPDSLIQQVRYYVCGEKNLHDLPPGWFDPNLAPPKKQ